jgi:hypothetical protein
MDFEDLSSAQNSTPMPDTGTMENSGVERYKSSLLQVIEQLYITHKTIGDIYKADAYEDVLFILKNFR